MCPFVASAQVGAQLAGANTYTDSRYGFSITKPHGWFLFTEPAMLRKGFVGLLVEASEVVEAPTGVALITRFPLETAWASFSPRIEVDVYPIKSEMTYEDERDVEARVTDDILSALHGNPDMATDVVVPPDDIELNGKRWRRVAFHAKMPVAAPDGREQRMLLVYIECYVHAAQGRVFFVQLVSRLADMPSYRPLLTDVIKSVMIEDQGIQTPVLTYSARPQPRVPLRRSGG